MTSSLIHYGSGLRGLVASALTLAILWSFEYSARFGVAKLLRLPAIVYLGEISYGIYLWHWPLIVVVRRFVVLSPKDLLLVAVVFSTGLASLSHRVVEQPIRRSPIMARHARASVFAGVVGSLAVGLIVVPHILGMHRKPVILPVSSKTIALQTLPTGAAPPRRAAPPQSNLTPVPSDAAINAARQPHNDPFRNCIQRFGDGGCLDHRGGARTVLVMGDSHLEAFLPMFDHFAVEHDVTLYTWMEYICPWEQSVLPAGKNAVPCKTNKAVLQQSMLSVIHADVIIVLNRGYDDPEHARPLYIDGDPTHQDPGIALATAMPDSVNYLLGYTRHLVVVEPWPSLSIDQNICLSASSYDEQCLGVAASGKLREDMAIEAIAAANPRVSTVNLNTLVCPRLPICDAVVDGTIVRRDYDHVSIPYAAKIAGAFDRLLSAVHAFGP